MWSIPSDNSWNPTVSTDFEECLARPTSEPVRHATTQVPKVETPVEKDVREVRDEIDALMKELTIDELRALRDRLQQSMDSPEEPVRK